MLRKLELQALRADLAAINELLRQRSEEDDPVGWLQFSHRKQEVENQLAEIDQGGSAVASVAVFFGGRPVIGSRGIIADFGASAISNFQSLISTRFASVEGRLGERGPIPQRDRTQLMITDVARGSFGFVLEEAEHTGDFWGSSLQTTIDEVVDLVYRVGAPDEEGYAGATEALDKRLLGSLKTFFKSLDDGGATIKIVDDRREITLHRADITRARERVEALELEEDTEVHSGILYLLPQSRRFELHPWGGGAFLRGTVTAECMNSLTDDNGELRPELLGRVAEVHVRVRTAKSPHQEDRKSFVLLSVSQLPFG